MIKYLINLIKTPKNKVCECHGYEIEEGKLPVKRTRNGFKVCPKAALSSSLEQMGNGIKLSPKLAAELKKRLEYTND